MIKTNAKTAAGKLDVCDPVWQRVREEAEAAIEREPALGGFIYATVLHHKRLEEAICHRIAQRLMHPDVDAGLLYDTFNELLEGEPSLGEIFRADLLAPDRTRRVAAHRPGLRGR